MQIDLPSSMYDHQHIFRAQAQWPRSVSPGELKVKRRGTIVQEKTQVPDQRNYGKETLFGRRTNYNSVANTANITAPSTELAMTFTLTAAPWNSSGLLGLARLLLADGAEINVVDTDGEPGPAV
jgi:hypothetical protein